MTPPPGPAVVVAFGLAWNLGRSIHNRRPGVTKRTVISRWASEHKRVAVPIAAGGGCWLTVHLARYVIDMD